MSSQILLSASFVSCQCQVEKEHIKECWHENVTQCHGKLFNDDIEIYIAYVVVSYSIISEVDDNLQGPESEQTSRCRNAFHSRHIYHRICARAGGGVRRKLLEGVQDHVQGAGLQLHPGDVHDASGEAMRRATGAAAVSAATARDVRGARARAGGARDGVQDLVRVRV